MNIWYEGENNYRLLTMFGKVFTTELLDVPTTDRTIHQIFLDTVNKRQTKYVDMLFSGGMDSECIMNSLLQHNVPVRAITMRLTVNGAPFNTHDLYYSEKYCRERNIEHKIIDLDVRKFFDDGKHIEYLVPYKIEEPHVATHFWLFEQCDGFPVIGGDYTWPWHTNDKLSPHRLSYSCYNRFLQDKGIQGIGNMLGHSQDANVQFIREHIKCYTHGMTNRTKKQVYENLGLGNLELRFRSYGWDIEPINKTNLKLDLLKHIGIVKHKIIWNNVIGSVLNGPGTNDSFQ
jgi:hypothetical protein